jgi:hypothetical protein
MVTDADFQALVKRVAVLEERLQQRQRQQQRPTMTTWIATGLEIGDRELDALVCGGELVDVVQTLLTTSPMCNVAGALFVWEADQEIEQWLRLTRARWYAYFTQIQHRFRRALAVGGDVEVLRKITFCKEVDKNKLLRRLLH